MELQKNNNMIVFSLNDNTKHNYYYNNEEKKIFYIIPSEDLIEDEEKKYITLCDGIDNCEFSYANNKLITKIYIGERIYSNSFSFNF